MSGTCNAMSLYSMNVTLGKGSKERGAFLKVLHVILSDGLGF